MNQWASIPLPGRLKPSTVAVSFVVQQHAEEATHLRRVRSVLVRSAEAGLFELARHDERLEAHLDGLLIAGREGLARVAVLAGAGDTGAVFSLAALAIASDEVAVLDRLIDLHREDQQALAAIASAFGWSRPSRLRGIVQRMLTSNDPARRSLGMRACRLQSVDPGTALASGLNDADVGVRLSALRAAGDLGRVDLLADVEDVISTGPDELRKPLRKPRCCSDPVANRRGVPR
jgi:uncharacterized protein (TIGR02270 family)